MEAISVNTDNFEAVVLQSTVPVVVDFMAPWCGYCRRLAPVVSRLAAKFTEQVIFAEVDIDVSPALAERYQVELVPTLLLFKSGAPGEALVNPPSQAQVESWIKAQTEI